MLKDNNTSKVETNIQIRLDYGINQVNDQTDDSFEQISNITPN